MKKLLFKHKSNARHWVGDAFPVRSIFTYNDLAKEISPFLLMDYAGPAIFTPSPDRRRKVGEHPHRGFETVTLVYAGQVEHRDSAGGGGVIGPGEVQWMTAASGLVHEEMHGKDFAQNGGTFEMVQLWVNLPAKSKMTQPRYQSLTKASIPEVPLPNGAGTARLVAGEYQGHKGPAKTFTPINLWNLHVKEGKRAELLLPRGFTTALFVLRGNLRLEDGTVIEEGELASFDKDDDLLAFTAGTDALVLLMNGQPLNEEIVGQGPFVMNTVDELRQAFLDFQDGKMGTLGRITGSD